MRSVANDISVPQQYRSAPVNNETTTASGASAPKTSTAKTSGTNTENNVSSAASNSKIPSIYEQNRNRMVLEEEMDKLMKVIMPDLGVKFRVHDSGSIITTVTNNDTQEVVREFPAEKILDIVYEMVQKLGIVANKKV